MINIKLNEERKNGLLSYSGAYNLNGVNFTYSIKEQTKGSHRMRGTVRMVDAKGHVIKIKKEQGKPANPRDIYANSSSERDIKDAIAGGIMSLYNSYGCTIGVNEKRDVSNCSFLSAVKSLGSRFLNQSSLAAATYDRKLKDLNNFAMLFEPTSIADVCQKDIRSAVKQINSNKVKYYLNMSRDFYYYCSSRGMFRGNNVFAEFLESNYIKQRASPADLQRKAFRKNSLTGDENETLNREIATADPLDARYTALLLCKDCGLDINTICNLSFKHIAFDYICKGSAQIVYSKSFTASAIFDYTKPCTGFASYELRRRSAAVIEKYGTSDVPVLLKNTGKCLKPTEIRQFFKERLTFIAGISEDDFKSIATLDERSGPVQLLLSHYKHMLIDYCGLDDDKATLKFLCGNSLSSDVTENNYRSYTDIEGQEFLHKLLQRIPFDNPDERRGINVLDSSDDCTVIEFTSTDISRLTRADDIVIDLAPGQTIELYSCTEFSFTAKKVPNRKRN